MKLDYCFFSEIGEREVNQDAVFAATNDDGGVFVVADGMGGHSGGEVASGAVINAIKRWWESATIETDIDRMEKVCSACIKTVSKQLYDDFHKKGQEGGTTVVMLIIRGNQYRVLSVGDSRAYRFGFLGFDRITVDDVWENLPEVRGSLSVDEILADQRLGKLTAAVGGYEVNEVHVYAGKAKSGDGFLLCSDGVYKVIGDRALKKVLCGKLITDARTLTEKVRDSAIKGETQDNFSAIVCRVV